MIIYQILVFLMLLLPFFILEVQDRLVIFEFIYDICLIISSTIEEDNIFYVYIEFSHLSSTKKNVNRETKVLVLY